MGSRHFSLEMSEVADIRDLMVGFEQHNQVQLEWRMSLVWAQNVPDIQILVLAHPQSAIIGEVPPLASASVKCSATNLKHFGSALIHAMYALDFQLALAELERGKPEAA